MKSFSTTCVNPPGYISISTFLDSTTPFVYNYKPASFKEDFISALTALVTAQDDPQRLIELNNGTKNILNDYQKDLPVVLKQVKLKIFLHTLTVSLHIFRHMHWCSLQPCTTHSVIAKVLNISECLV